MDRVRTAHARGIAGTHRLFPIRRAGRCRAESRPARAHRHPGQRLESRRRLTRPRRRSPRKVKAIPGVSECSSRRTSTCPRMRLEIDRSHASELGLTEKEVVGNVITALTSNGMIAPSYWVDPKRPATITCSPSNIRRASIKTLSDLKGIPLRAASETDPTRLDAVTKIVPHPVADRSGSLTSCGASSISTSRPHGEDLGARRARRRTRSCTTPNKPEGVRVTIRGSVQAMNSSFTSFGLGLILVAGARLSRCWSRNSNRSSIRSSSCWPCRPASPA